MFQGIEFEVISASTQFVDEALRLRAEHASLAAISTSYKVLVDGDEAAFIILDRNSHLKVLYIYELVVRSDRRRIGLGTRVMAAIECLAREENWPLIGLRPHALDKTITNDILISWYQSLEFSWCQDEKKIMCKSVTGGRP